MTMKSLQRNFHVILMLIMSQRSIEYVLISAPKVHWRMQPTAARRSGRFNTMHSPLRALHVSLNQNCPQMIETEQWPRNNFPNLNGIEMSYLGSDSWSCFETFIESPKQFLN